MEKLTYIFTPLFIITLILDVVVFAYTNGKNMLIKNRYYMFHLKYGFKRTLILKMLFGIFVIYGLFNPYLAPGELFVFICIYVPCTAWSLIAVYFVKPTVEGDKNIEFNKELDSIIGLLAYPFEYLDSKKPFFKHDTNCLKWSWWAFSMPEYWYFKNELLGAGYFSWALIFFYFLLLEYIGMAAIIIVISIRILSGLLGQRVYFAKYGNYE